MHNPISPLHDTNKQLSPGATALLVAICREMVHRPSKHIVGHNSEMASRAKIDVQKIRTYQQELQDAELMNISFDDRKGFVLAAQRTCYRLTTVPKKRDVVAA